MLREVLLRLRVIEEKLDHMRTERPSPTGSEPLDEDTFTLRPPVDLT